MPADPSSDHRGLSALSSQIGAFQRFLQGAGEGQSLTGLTGLGLALIILFSVLMPDRFPTVGTAQSMMFQVPELGILALAMVVPLISSGLNLAIIATTNQCALLMAYVLTHLAPTGSSPGLTLAVIVLALVVGLIHTAVIGFIAGWLVASLGVHPILVTLGTQSIIDGVSIYLTRGTVIAGFPDAFQWIGNGVVLGIPMPFVVFIGVVVVVAVILSRTPFGIAVFMIGSNQEATRYSGIDTRSVLIRVYVMSSVLCFVAATLMMARFNSASAGYAQSYLLITILAAVLGGVDPNGGFGRIAGLTLALLVLQIISSGLNQLGLSQHLTLAIWGLTLLGTMTIKGLAARFGLAFDFSFLKRPESPSSGLNARKDRP